MKLALTAAIAFFPLLAGAKSALTTKFTAQLFKIDSDYLMYVQKGSYSVVGDRLVSKSVYHYPGEPKRHAVLEEIELKGGKFVRYEIVHKQLEEKWLIEAKGDRVHFSQTFLKTGKVKRDEEKLAPNFVVGPTVLTHLQAHWKEMVAGKEIRVRFGVPGRRETIGFKLFKNKELKFKGQDVYEVLMKPSNWVISLLVDPVRIYLSKSDRKIVRFIGRTLPHKRDGDDWVDLDADTYFHYDVGLKK